MKVITYVTTGLRVFGCGLVVFGSKLTAQVAPAAPAGPEANDDVVELSPFTVSADTGWSANQTLSANRIKQEIKEVPIAIDAITSDFTQDLGLGTVDEVFKFVAGAYAPPDIENDGQQDVIAFRGLAQRGNASRNYFRWYAPSDNYNVERIDFGKGSNSLVFGEIEPGGQASVFTKRARMRDFGKITAGLNSEGGYRLELDVNRKVTDQLALRVNAVKRENRTYQDASQFGLEGVHGALTWQPFKTTQVRLEFERGDFDNVRGFGGVQVREISARTRAFSNGVTYTSDGDWVRSRTAANGVPTSYVTASGKTILATGTGNDFSRGPAGGSPSLVEGGFFDVTMLNPATGAVIGTRRVEGFPKEYNIRGAFDRQGRPFKTYTLTVEQRLGPVDFEVAYNHQSQHANRTDNFFNSTISLDFEGRPYIDSTLDIKRFASDTDAFRAIATYKFDQLSWTEQTLVVSGEYTEEQFENIRWQYYNIRPVEKGLQSSIDITHDRARLRIYLDDPQFYSRALFDRMRPGAVPDTADVAIRPLRLIGSGGGSMDGTQWRQAAAFSASLSGKYLRNRLNSLIGFRRDFNRLWEYDSVAFEGQFGEEPFPSSREDAAPGQYVQNLGQRGALTTFSSGLSFAVTKDINVYAAYGESFRFQDALTFDRERIGAIQGESKELGIKGDFWNRRASLSLGVFEIQRLNAPTSYNSLPSALSADEAEYLMNRGLPSSDPNFKPATRLANSASRNFNSTEKSKGFDLTLTSQPLDGLQLRFTLAYADVEATADVGNMLKYYNDALADPNFLTPPPTSPINAAGAATILIDTKSILDTFGTPGRATGPRAAKWSASWVVDYDFGKSPWERLKGVRFGINGAWRDDYLFGISNGQELIGGTRHDVSAYIMRDQRIFGHRTRIRLGARNLFDLENGDLRKTGFTTMADGTNVYRFSYVEPVQVDLTLTLDF